MEPDKLIQKIIIIVQQMKKLINLFVYFPLHFLDWLENFTLLRLTMKDAPAYNVPYSIDISKLKLCTYNCTPYILGGVCFIFKYIYQRSQIKSGPLRTRSYNISKGRRNGSSFVAGHFEGDKIAVVYYFF